MIVEIVPQGGIGHAPVVLHAAQLVIRRDDGTPIGAASHYGPDEGIAITNVGDPEFDRMLRLLGVNTTVVVERIQLSKPPAGARLLVGPKPV